jgi:hypothetical protein
MALASRSFEFQVGGTPRGQRMWRIPDVLPESAASSF